jgi:hypothetical protein
MKKKSNEKFNLKQKKWRPFNKNKKNSSEFHENIEEEKYFDFNGKHIHILKKIHFVLFVFLNENH